MRSGFISIVGKPNVGKSSLLNALIGKHVSIVSDKTETTRTSIVGVYNDPLHQLIFTDTPGFDKLNYLLNKRSDDIANSSILDADIVLYVVDRKYNSSDIKYIERLNKKIPTILVVNKIDQFLNENNVKDILNSYLEVYEFLEYYLVSTKEGIGISPLLESLKAKVKDTILYYPLDQITNLSFEGVISELVREQIMLNMSEEIPHQVAVLVESLEELDYGVYFSRVNIIIERKAHKGLIIGKNGTMIKKIRHFAERNIKKTLESDVKLELFVKVVEDWRSKKEILDKLGVY
ncbi:MAG: GTPase Era [Acholeplasmatales bacterium]|jgi:GTP-binding protein Era|nr:GTPase Era [Acholeplasmatales bacterium]